MYELTSSAFLFTIISGLFLAGIIAVFIAVAAHHRKNKTTTTSGDDIMLAGIGIPIGMMALAGLVTSLFTPQMFGEYHVSGTVTGVEDVVYTGSFGTVDSKKAVSVEGIDDKQFVIDFSDDTVAEQVVGKNIALRCSQTAFESDDTVNCSATNIQ